MRRYLLKKGDKSTNGGVVLEGVENCMHYGTPLTYIGAKVYCNGCKTTGVIVPKGPRWRDSMHGKEQALDGDLCVCKCTPSPIMLASQQDSFQSFDSHQLAAQSFTGNGSAMTGDYRGVYDERVRVIDANGRPVASTPYHIRTASGAVYKGLTDSSGYCPRVYTDDAAQLDIAIGMRALERWSATL